MYPIFNNITFNGYIKNGTTYPEWFGAKGDGAKGCYSFIQNTIDSMSGGYLELQIGTYLVSSTIELKRGIIIKVKGNDDTKKKGTIIKLADKANCSMLKLAIDAENYNGIENFTFDGNASNQSQPAIGVKIHGFITSYIENVMMKGMNMPLLYRLKIHQEQ